MEDMRKLQEMGMVAKEMFDEMDDAIQSADEGKELIEAFRKIGEVQNRLDTFKTKPVKAEQIRKHNKPPLEKNRKKRMRKQALANIDA